MLFRSRPSQARDGSDGQGDAAPAGLLPHLHDLRRRVPLAHQGQNLVAAITGLGGPELLERHALDTAAAFNAMNPEYIGMLTLMVEPGTPLYDWVHDGSFRLLDQRQVLEETRLLVEGLDSPGSVFRMNHASNYLSLRGTLNKDKAAMLAEIDRAEKDLSRQIGRAHV